MKDFLRYFECIKLCVYLTSQINTDVQVKKYVKNTSKDLTLYVMLCYALLCYVMLCYVMLCYVMLCYVVLCYVMFCYVMYEDSF